VSLWLEDMISFESEAQSLTEQLVHSYEELHLLYELGEVLGSIMNVEQACAMVVDAVVEPLDAAEALIFLLRDGDSYPAAKVTNRRTENGVADPHASTMATLHVNGRAIGSLELRGRLEQGDFTSDQIKLLEGVAAIAAPAIRSAQLYEVARMRADTDGLTHIANHRSLHEQLDRALQNAKAEQTPVSIILIDLDDFKIFNDVYGHPVGDSVLKTVAQCLQNSTRSDDIVGRYGGDEFMLILPRTAASSALDLANRVLNLVSSCELVVNDARLPISVSIGVATFPVDGRTKDQLIAHVDSALYESKRNGGHTVRQAHIPRADWLVLQGSTFSALEGLVRAVDAKDQYTRHHTELVTEAALLLAQRLNLSEDTCRALRIAGLLHDVGKVGMPDEVLKKPGKLTADEYAVMKNHVKLSEMIIKDVPYLNDVLAAVAHHHERFDGTGYPYRKSGEAIPLLGRIMAVADAYSAMSLDRPYRKGMSWPDIRTELKRGAGTQFDPDLVDLFIEIMDEIQARSETPPHDDGWAQVLGKES
jgi:diguanylate cyclase (GGDEF)-like protein